MYDDKNIFVDLDDSFRSFVKFGNNEKVSMLRKEKIRITLKHGKSYFISNVSMCRTFIIIC